MTTRARMTTSVAVPTVLEKPQLDICFIPIICAAPLIYAHSHGVFARHGLDVTLRSAPGWSGIKELMVYDKVDAVHMLAPMPLACSLGLDAPVPVEQMLSGEYPDGCGGRHAVPDRIDFIPFPWESYGRRAGADNCHPARHLA